MEIRNGRRTDRVTAECLLTGGPAVAADFARPLADAAAIAVFRAAFAPGTP